VRVMLGNSTRVDYRGGDMTIVGSTATSVPGQIHRRAQRGSAKRSRRDAEMYVRRDLARELHDGIVQSLTIMLLEIENYKAEQFGRRTVIEQLEGLQGTTRQVLSSIRGLLVDLRRETLEGDQAFDQRLASDLVAFENRTGIHAVLNLQGPRRPVAPAAAAQVRSMVLHALTNAQLHSGSGFVRVTLDGGGRSLRVAVEDDGCGVPVGFAEGTGLLGMRERAMLLGASMQVDDSPLGGLRVQLEVPSEFLGG